MYLTKDEFLQKFGILPQEFEEADISWEERTAVVPQPPEGHRTSGGKAGA